VAFTGIAGQAISFSSAGNNWPILCRLACHQKRIVVEVDGSQHIARARADAARTAFLNSQGYRVLRFWNNEVLQQTEAVITAIYEALSEDRPFAPHP